MLLLHESREESIEPHPDTPFTSSAALYFSTQSAQNGKLKNKSNRGGNNGPQPGLLGAPPAQSFGVGPPQPSPMMFSNPQQLPAHPFHQPPVTPHAYYYGPPQSPTLVPVPPQQPSMPVLPPPQPSFGGHASQYSATRHMTFNQGTMHSLTPCNSNFIQVGNGAVVPARYIGQCNLHFSPWPLLHKNVLVSDKIIKNLISVHRFTIDNSVSVEFDPFGFIVKDLKTGSFLQRCDSDHHDLYPVLPHSPQSTLASTNVVVSFDVWHRWLGHPGAVVFQFLLSRNTSPTTPHKLAPRSFACVYLGPSTNHHGCRCLDLITQKFIILRHVVFDETHFPFPDFQPHPSSEDYDSFDIDESLPSLSPIPPPVEPSGTSSTPSTPTATFGHPMSTRSRTGSLKPKQIFNLSVTSDISPIPLSTAQAMFDPHWRAAMDAEMTAFLSNYTWDLVPKPSDVDIVGSRWLYRHNPVVKPAAIRTVLSISISCKWPIHQLDVKNIFLHGDLTETVYMRQPPSYIGSAFPDHVCRLRKALYDIILTASSPTLISMVISQLSYDFSMSDLGPTLADTKTKLAADGESVYFFMHDPRLPHFNMLKRILRSLKGTLSHYLHIKALTIDRLVACSDVDWAGCPNTRRFTSGFCVYVGDNLVSWSSKRHLVSRCSAEAEYQGIANVVAETAWLRNLLLKLGCPLSCHCCFM
ncbi:hypothetical protein OSB04_016244 [Centaurea solstitialis]|uniref:Reverse transcriptase Ty1/copia-type domain-containing protein n=1 Tax=Centaurea solstitialis TaxID=347529 RepID=A0AA38WJI5_9ASTR|nr:hypothetical protein OSB04_016244 [Centaurea solstitialis]